MAASAQDDHAKRRRGLTLALLTATYFFSYMDRQILAILLEPIRAELRLSDTQLGVLSGLAFATLYAALSIPVARLADRGSRRNIVAVSLALWSAMTALCGLAQNFLQLLAARIGVGVGEAGSSPPSHAMIADLYAPHERARAMAVYALGVVLGGGFGTLIGGTLSDAYGWRVAIVAVGLPGLALAIMVRLFVIEPRRGLSESRASPGEDPPPSLGEGLRSLWAEPAARHLVAGATVTSLIGYALVSFGPSYFVRRFGVSPGAVGVVLGPIVAGVGIVSGIGGGAIADRWARRRGLHVQSLLVAILKAIALPFMLLVYLADSFAVAAIAYAGYILFAQSYLGPTFALLQGLAPVRLRATWAAITLLVINLVGLGLGPTSLGVLSDLYKPMLGEQSLRYALLTAVAATPWAIYHYWSAAALLKEREAS